MAHTTINITGVNTTSITANVVFTVSDWYIIIISTDADFNDAFFNRLKDYYAEGSGTIQVSVDGLTPNTNYYIYAMTLYDVDNDVEDWLVETGVSTLSTAVRKDYLGTPWGSTPWAGLTYIPMVAHDTSISGKARIGRTSSVSASGRARIKKTMTTYKYGSARIQTANLSSISGCAKVNAAIDCDIYGVASIYNPNQRVSESDIDGLARIANTYYTGIDGSARIQSAINSDISGMANIEKRNDAYIDGMARIASYREASITGVAKIMVSTPEKLPENWENNEVAEPMEWDKDDKEAQEWAYNNNTEATEWGSSDKEAESWSSSSADPIEWKYRVEETS